VTDAILKKDSIERRKFTILNSVGAVMTSVVYAATEERKRVRKLPVNTRGLKTEKIQPSNCSSMVSGSKKPMKVAHAVMFAGEASSTKRAKRAALPAARPQC
jgi:hypothetical protein